MISFPMKVSVELFEVLNKSHILLEEQEKNNNLEIKLNH